MRYHRLFKLWHRGRFVGLWYINDDSENAGQHSITQFCKGRAVQHTAHFAATEVL